MKKIFMILLVICAVCMSSMERETQAQDILQQIYSKIDSVPRMETMIDSLITLLATMDIYIAVDTLTVEADSLNWMMTYLLINSDSALVVQASEEGLLDSLVTLLTALGGTSLDSLVELITAQGVAMDSALFWSDSLDVRQAALATLLTSLETKATARNAALDSSLWWSDSTDTRYAAFITWYDSIGTLLIANSALLATANTWHDSTAYLQDAIATLQNSIYARLDSIMHIFAVPSTRRIDASADWANATLTRVIHTAALDTFQGHYWSFALANDAGAACTLWTYSGGVADQGNDGWPLKPGESVGHLTNYPAPIDSFSFSKTAADLLKWIIIGR